MRTATKEELMEKVLFTLNKNEKRASYEAVASVIGGIARGVSKYLKDHRPEASWVVSKSPPHLPTEYSEDKYHPKLKNSEVILSGEELKQLLEKDHRDLT